MLFMVVWKVEEIVMVAELLRTLYQAVAHRPTIFGKGRNVLECGFDLDEELPEATNQGWRKCWNWLDMSRHHWISLLASTN